MLTEQAVLHRETDTGHSLAARSGLVSIRKECAAAVRYLTMDE